MPTAREDRGTQAVSTTEYRTGLPVPSMHVLHDCAHDSRASAAGLRRARAAVHPVPAVGYGTADCAQPSLPAEPVQRGAAHHGHGDPAGAPASDQSAQPTTERRTAGLGAARRSTGGEHLDPE